MGFRIQRRIRLGKFLHLNISKSGIGVSAGVTGLRISTGPRGSFVNLGLPGTGISYRKKIGSKTLKELAVSSAGKQIETEEAEEDKLPSPGFFSPKHEKELAKAMEAYHQGDVDDALEHFLEAADKEPGAAILAAALLAEQNLKDYKPIELLETVIQSDDEFPTELMEKYLSSTTINVAVTSKVTVAVPIDGLAATLLLVELYQAQRRVREAIFLLEEIEHLTHDPVLTLSLCELYSAREMWDEIIDRAKNIESVDDVTLQILIYYGLAMAGKGLHEAAVSVFTDALRRKKDRNPLLLQEAAYWRAIAYQEQGKNSRANQELQKLYAENPDFRDVEQRLQDFSIR